MFAPETDIGQNFDDNAVVMLDASSLDLRDLDEYLTQEDWSSILDTQNEFSSPIDLNFYPTPPASTYSPYTSEPVSPAVSEANSVLTNGSQSPREIQSFNSCDEYFGWSNIPSPASSVGTPLYNTQNNFKFDAQVPRAGESTKALKKRVPLNMKACKHIWQFLRDLLQNPEYRTWITWLDAKRGIFKILKPDETAMMWRHYKSQDRRKESFEGDLDEKDQKKKYPNMARGIRYSRDCGYFETITKEEMRDFGKKLVYKFSKTTTAHCGWLRSIMTN